MAELHAARRARLAAHLAERDIPAALVTRLVNVQYLTGLKSSNAAVLITDDGTATLATDGRYATAAAAVAPDVELVVIRGVATELATRAGQRGLGRLAVEQHDVTLELAAAIRAALEDAGSTTELTEMGRAIEELRAVKDESEIDSLRRACEISCQALQELFGAGSLLGRSERVIARDLEWRMYAAGADAIAFETIVASGPNSAVPHHRPTDRVVERGDFVKIDFGAAFGGYHADCTRTCVVGGEPAAWQREIYDIVAASQRAGREALTPGGERIDVDKASRSVIEDAGYGEQFGHGTGHGVGLEVHEAPTLGYSATGTLAERMTVTVEPGIYLPDRGGVRIEDTLVVRADGPELLTPLTKELLVLDA
ncbi:M24 family metallopeptidase [Phytoactinopolyspora halotolerans]|uniref:Aminopeptidase P family protein n=1 Tax=Phytoactinopolyspora halotolerans TaxID=1981512 RepID=A0A6L9SG39_9ACTN|nr:aminopeptidase P family protein [Phytoactinopolyspora halotolerans]NEE04037.1 aminopeptidase P family protein [Phytoactinopolyspora halotolerans]